VTDNGSFEDGGEGPPRSQSSAVRKYRPIGTHKSASSQLSE
jgi:hypothetical protein